MDRIIHNAYIIPLDAKRSMRAVMAESIRNSSLEMNGGKN
jgi:hypothetical protein